MDKNYQVYPEQFHPTVIERLTSVSDELQSLSTEDKTSLVAALNEITGKQAIVDAIGNPLNADDKWREMAEKIKILIDEMRDELSNKGLIVRGLELEQLIEKIKEIPEDTEEIRASIIGILTEKIGSPTTPEDSVDEMGEKLDTMTQEFRDKLIDKGVVLEGDEKISELVAKVDGVGSDEALVQALVNAIGEPCTTEDSVYDICDKLETMTDNLRDILSTKNIEVPDNSTLVELIEITRNLNRQKQPLIELYKSGKLDNEASGGLTVVNNGGSDGVNNGGVMTHKLNSDHIFITAKQTIDGSWLTSALFTKNTIDLTYYDRLIFNINPTFLNRASGMAAPAYIQVGVSKEQKIGYYGNAIKGSTITQTGTQTVSVDVSTLTGSYYILIATVGCTDYRDLNSNTEKMVDCKVIEITLEDNLLS